MGDNLEIIILAIIAIFILYRLYSVLGQVNDEDNIFNSSNNNIIDITKHAVAENVAVQDEEFRKFENEINIIKKLRPEFNMSYFMKAVEAAFESIITAQNKGDLDLLKNLLSSKMLQSFEREINERSKKSINFNKTLVAINNIEVKDIKTKLKSATIYIEFSFEQICFEKDADDNIVSGDESQIVDMVELWQFSKDLSNASPVWLLEKISTV